MARLSVDWGTSSLARRTGDGARAAPAAANWASRGASTVAQDVSASSARMSVASRDAMTAIRLTSLHAPWEQDS